LEEFEGCIYGRYDALEAHEKMTAAWSAAEAPTTAFSCQRILMPAHFDAGAF